MTMPALGESVTEGTVTRWLKQEGDQVEVDEPLLEVSTDKVDTEIPSPAAGVLSKILVAEDETVEVGAQLALIGGGGGAAAAAPAEPTQQATRPSRRRRPQPRRATSRPPPRRPSRPPSQRPPRRRLRPRRPPPPAPAPPHSRHRRPKATGAVPT